MTFASSLLAKLLIAATVITPAAGYGGYCLYEYCTSSSFDKQITQQGYRFSPISLENNASFLQDPSKFSEKLEGDWRCTKQLFGNIVIPSTDANSVSEVNNLTIPNAPSVTKSDSDSNLVGCLVADLGRTKDSTNKKAAFLKWELALRSENRGFIYIGYFSAEKSGSEAGDTPFQSTNMIFEVVEEANKWQVKNGLYWAGNLRISSEFSTSQNLTSSITLLDNKKWDSGNSMCAIKGKSEDSKCGEKDQWEFNRYIGFWEPTGNQKRVIDAINIEVTKDSKTYKQEIWSNDHFDFDTSSPNYENQPNWKSGVDYVYPTNTKAWGKMETGTSAESYLKAIYSPWAKKKGTWTAATKDLCEESKAKNLSGDTEENRKLAKFCYRKS